jgi:hypothetical protein
MASDLESTTSVGTGDSRAASTADSNVPDMAAEMCRDTIESAPASAAATYASSSSCGLGRDVETGV